MPRSVMEKAFHNRKKDWLEELSGIKKFFRIFHNDFPQELWDEYEGLRMRLLKMSDKNNYDGFKAYGQGRNGNTSGRYPRI